MTLPHVATIQRKSKSGSTYIFADVGTTPCFLQPISTQMAEAYGITFTKSFSCYVPIDAAIAPHDRLVIAGVTYGVAGLQARNYGTLMHKRLVLEVS